MAKKITKEDLKNPDSFIATTDKIAHALENYKTPIFIVLALGLVIGVGKVGFDIYSKEKEASAQAALYNVESEYIKIREDLDKKHVDKEAKTNKNNKDKSKSAAKIEKPEKTPESLAKTFGGVLPKYKEVIATHPKTNAAAMAAMDLAFLSFEYKDYERARVILESVAGKLSSSDFFFGLVHTQLGTTYSNLGDYKKAIEHFEKVLSVDNQEHIYPDVILKTGINYEKLGETNKAIEMYERVSEEYESTSAARSAKALLRVLTLNKSNTTKG